MDLNAHTLGWAFGALLAAFAAVTLAVARGWSDRLDRAVIARMPLTNGHEGRPPRIDSAMRDLSAMGGDTVHGAFVIVVASGLFVEDDPATAVRFLGMVLGARLLVVLLKKMIQRQRPPARDRGVATYTTSFPSGHTLMSTVMLVAAAVLLTPDDTLAMQNFMLIVAVLVSIAIGSARVYLRVHWPSDILAGWLAGGAWSAGILLAFDHFFD